MVMQVLYSLSVTCQIVSLTIMKYSLARFWDSHLYVNIWQRKSKDTELNTFRTLLPCFLMTYETHVLQTVRASCHISVVSA